MARRSVGACETRDRISWMLVGVSNNDTFGEDVYGTASSLFEDRAGLNGKYF